MPTRHRPLPTQLAELALAAPQVVAHRLARLAAAGHAPTKRDRLEFQRMGSEKLAAFGESWFAMGAEVLRVQQLWAAQAWRSCWFPWAGAFPWPPSGRALDRAWHGVLGRGLAPVHRRAVANAKRLGRTPRR